MSVSETDLTYTLYSKIAEIAQDEWDACEGAENPFVSYAFLSLLEDSNSVGDASGWIPLYVKVHTSAGQLVAFAPLYAKGHSYGEYVFDQSWADALQRAGGSYYPKLQVAVPFCPVPGSRLLRSPRHAATLEDVGKVLRRICADLRMSSIHVTFCTREEQDSLTKASWMARLGVQFHWHNHDFRSFDDFLSTLSSNHRKSIRRERRDVQASGVQISALRGLDIKAHHWDAFYLFYLATVERKWGSAYLTRDFFAQLSTRLGDSVVLIFAAAERRPIAGALNIIGGDTLYGRNWGAVEDRPFLHFELCYYRAIDFAIDQKLGRVEAGAQGVHKIQRGYVPTPTFSAHWIAHPGLSEAVGHFLERERDAVSEEIKELATLAPFKQNAT